MKKSTTSKKKRGAVSTTAVAASNIPTAAKRGQRTRASSSAVGTRRVAKVVAVGTRGKGQVVEAKQPPALKKNSAAFMVRGGTKAVRAQSFPPVQPTTESLNRRGRETPAPVSVEQQAMELVGTVPDGTLHNRTISRMEAAQALIKRRTARKSIIEFCQFTHPTYSAAWFHHVVAEHVEKFLWNKFPGIHGLMVFMPPRHGKSELIAIRTPAWDLGGYPEGHYIATAYGDELATTFSRACRNIIETPAYQRLFKHKLKTRGDTKWELVRINDDQRATYISSGILSALTGEGATRLVIDDPVKNAEEAYSKKIREKTFENYRTAASTRMAPKGKKLLAMTRWHEDDLAGRLIALALKDKMADQWLVIVLAATNDTGEDSYIWNTLTGEKVFFAPYKSLWPEAFPREDLDRIRANQGPVNWDALYMQRPVSPTGGIFKRANWSYFDKRPTSDLLIQVYDTAQEQGQENDYSASVTMGANAEHQFPIFDAWRDKVGFPALVAKVYERWEMARRTYGRHPDRVCIEKRSSGHGLIQQLETNNLAGVWVFPADCILPDGTLATRAVTLKVPFIPVTPMPAVASKLVRANSISGYHESRCLMLPQGADWVDDFVDEHALFDKGVHDDWVDCTVHGVTFYTRPVEDQEEIVTYNEPIHISSGIDEFELEQLMMGRGQL